MLVVTTLNLVIQNVPRGLLGTPRWTTSLAPHILAIDVCLAPWLVAPFSTEFGKQMLMTGPSAMNIFTRTRYVPYVMGATDTSTIAS